MVSGVCLLPKVAHYCFAPYHYICDKITKIAEAIFGYLLRIITFQLGEIRIPGAYYIMRIYQRLSSNPKDEKRFDTHRLEQSKRLLIQFGGVESILHPADGQAQIHCMTFKSEDFYNKFHRLGAEPFDVIYKGRRRTVFLNPPSQTEKFFFPTIHVRMPNGDRLKAALLPEKPEFNGAPPMYLHCHSPGQSMCMPRRLIAQQLAAGYDVTVWDPRGTAESTGRASEGGYYLDAEAVFQHVRNLGYAPNRIYLSGFCEGAASAIHLKKLYHHLGVHLIASNPFTSMKEVLQGYGWLGKMGIRFGLQALKDPNLNIEQDGFDNVKKLSNLPRSEGKFIFIHTDPDTTMPRGSVQKLCAAVAGAGPIHEILRVHDNPKVNAHITPPYECPNLWRDRYIHIVT